MATLQLLTALLIFSLLSISSSLPTETLTNAGETLSNSGYISMSLTLTLISQSLLSQPSSATLFTPPDSVFSDAGQPSLDLLRLHFSPFIFTEDSLRSLPYGSKIATLSFGNYLIITTNTNSSTSPISLNNITINGSPIFDDGLLVVFGISEFLNPNFTIPDDNQSHESDISCIAAKNSPEPSFADYAFAEASGVLKSRGYSVMAYFLDLQLVGFLGRPNLTVFAPADDAIVDYAGLIPDYPSLFLRHVLPCKVSWTDLVSVGNGTMIPTYLDRFSINVTNYDRMVMVNNISVTFPDMYYSDWLIVHGLRESLLLLESEDFTGEGEFPEINNSMEAVVAPAHSPSSKS